MVQREGLTSDYPRILIISPAPFSLRTGAGVTFTNLFRGWPVERIAMIYGDRAERDESVCKDFYILSNREFTWVRSFRILQNFFSRYRSAKPGEAASGAKKISSRKKVILFFSRLIIGDEFPKETRVSPELEDWIKRFNPEVIYSAVAKSVTYVDLTLKIAKRFNLPVVTHIMDDWQSMKYRTGVFGPFLRLRLKKSLNELLKVSRIRLGICDLMCEAYKERYGVVFMPFLNAVDISGWKSKIRKDRSAGKPFRIMYHGSIYHGSILGRVCSQIDSLTDICKVVEKLNSDGFDAEMIVHTPLTVANYYRRYFRKFPHVFVQSDFIPADEIAGFLSEKDLLILPITFNKKGSYLLRYSMSTKVPEFMMSGTPVLLYGPKNTAPIQYAFREGWGYAVTERNVNILERAIKTLMEDRALREKLSKRAMETASLNHDREKIKREFQEIFIRTASDHART